MGGKISFEEKMLAFAKDITQNNPNHPEESKNSELKEYMGYQRTLNHERLIYHALDLAKTSLQNHMNEFEDNQEKLKKRTIDKLSSASCVSHAILSY